MKNSQSKILVIVESPSKAHTIEKYLGKNYIVKASVGHIRDLPKSNKNAIDIEHGFVPHYVISEDKTKVVSELKSLAKKANDVILATDPDREGEAISWHIAQVLKLEDQKTKRVVFHEITERAVKEAFTRPRTIDQNLVKAQEARRVLDRLVGYDLSGLIWKKVRYGLSAGRVQSPALRILVEREREIRTFIPENYWLIKAILETPKTEKIEFECKENPRTKEEADRIVSAGQNEPWCVNDVREEETTRKPKAPFTTSTLQQAASSRLGLSPSMTMRMAQKLYEAGHITYMRTDSTNLSKDAIGAITTSIISKYGKEYSSPRTYTTKSKNAQEAHEAIRPTNFSKPSAGGSDAERKVYDLIWRRAVASQMSDARILKTTVLTNIDSGNIPDFNAMGSRTLFRGWLEVDIDARGEEVELPKTQVGEKMKLDRIFHEAKQTEPPNRYSEAGLVKELERRGIGRPSTYASIIQTLLTRKYADKINRSLAATEVGEIVTSFLENNFQNIISDTFTASMEDNLDDIAAGKKDYEKTLSSFYGPFSMQIKGKEDIAKVTDLGDTPAEYKCPVCGGPMIYKLGKSGKFMSCQKFPECKGARTGTGEEMKEPVETGEMCPECLTRRSSGAKEVGKLIERQGKYGSFISCNRYPKCRYIKKDEAREKEQLAKASTGVACPKCKNGVIVERRGKFGPFFSCSNYPTCNFAMKARPTGDTCKLCGSLTMAGTKTIPTRCSSKECPNHKPAK